MNSREAWRSVIARSGNSLSLLVMAGVCMLVEVFSPFGVAAFMWWSGAMVLLILSRRALKKERAER